MHDVVVVGSGLFGSIIARHLRELGQDVCVVDDRRPDSGSAPAGCVIRPSWVSSMSGPDLRAGLELLDKYFDLREVTFNTGLGRRAHCHRVEPGSILVPPDVVGRVSAIDMGRNLQENSALVVEGGPILLGRRVIVAAGLWTPVLCPWVETWGRWGWSHKGPMIEEPRIKLWAPYRQVVAFNMDRSESWSGDGSALIEKSAGPAACGLAQQRCADVVGCTIEQLTTTRGVRPYAQLTKGQPCLISRRGAVWAVTGGAKNGTIAAAWAARRLQKEMGL